jgi:hypothetical protein
LFRLGACVEREARLYRKAYLLLAPAALDFWTSPAAPFDYTTRTISKSDLLIDASLCLSVLTRLAKKSSPSGEISEGESEGPEKFD